MSVPRIVVNETLAIKRIAVTAEGQNITVTIAEAAAGVSSVNGQTDVVVLSTDDITEGVANLYYTDTRVDDYLTANPPVAETGDITFAGSELTSSTDDPIEFTTNAKTLAFNTAGELVFPDSSTISESGSSVFIAPPDAGAGQTLQIRRTSSVITSDHPGGYASGDTITITVAPNNTSPVTGTMDFTFTSTGTINSGNLGRALTGTLTYSSEVSKTIVFTVPLGSTLSDFTLTLSNNTGDLPAPSGTLTLSWLGSTEDYHVHLMAGDPALVDLYLGDDDQYVKIEKDGGGVVVGTNTNTHNWRFDETGAVTFPTLTTPLKIGTATTQTLKFANPAEQVIIAGPDTTATYTTSPRLIVQGTNGYAGTAGEGGDIYLWAGAGGTDGGSGGDIKLDAGYGSDAGEGGTIKIRGGASETGSGGFVDIHGGAGVDDGGPVRVYSGDGAERLRIDDTGLLVPANTLVQWPEGSARGNRINFRSTTGDISGIRVQAPVSTSAGEAIVAAFSTNDIDNGSFINIRALNTGATPLRIQTGVYTAGVLGASGGVTFVDNVTAYATVNPSGPTASTDLTTKSYVDGLADNNTTYDFTATSTSGGVNLNLAGSDATTDTVKLTDGGHITAVYTSGTAVTLGSDATNANTASTIVARDASGDFSAGTITANLANNSYVLGALEATTNSAYTFPAPALNSVTNNNGLDAASSMPASTQGNAAQQQIIHYYGDTFAGTSTSAALQFKSSPGNSVTGGTVPFTGAAQVAPSATQLNGVLGTINYNGYGTTGFTEAVATQNQGGGFVALSATQLQSYAAEAFADGTLTISGATITTVTRVNTALAAVTVTGTKGQIGFTTFSSPSVGMAIVVTGTNSGTSTGISAGNYYMVAVAGTTGCTLSATPGGVPITTTAGTTTGLTFTRQFITVGYSAQSNIPFGLNALVTVANITNVTDGTYMAIGTSTTTSVIIGALSSGVPTLPGTQSLSLTTVTAAATGFRIRAYPALTTMNSGNRLDLMDHKASAATYRADSFVIAGGAYGNTSTARVTVGSTNTTFALPVVFPNYTAVALRAVTGAVGWQACVNNSASGGNPNGMMAFWDTTNARWSYIHDNSAV